jgi:hypothetical protein
MKLLILSVAVVSCLIAGCGRPSSEGPEAKREAAQQKKKQHENYVRVLTEIAQKYSATPFPPKSLDQTKRIFTYELQQFFKNKDNRRILFPGFLEDIEDKSGVVIVEFSAKIGGLRLRVDDLVKPLLVFRLQAQPSQIRFLLGGKRPGLDWEGTLDYNMRWLLNKPDYFVIAEIQSLNRAHKYKTEEALGSQDSEVEIQGHLKYVAVGQLIDIVRVPKGDEPPVGEGAGKGVTRRYLYRDGKLIPDPQGDEPPPGKVSR